MPVIVVETIDGTITQGQKKKIVDTIYNVGVNMGVLVERINVIFHDNPANNWAVAAKFQTEEKKPPVVVLVEVFAEWWSEKEKKDILDALTPVLEEVGFIPERTNVILKDNLMRNWAVAGKFHTDLAGKPPHSI